MHVFDLINLTNKKIYVARQLIIHFYLLKSLKVFNEKKLGVIKLYMIDLNL